MPRTHDACDIARWLVAWASDFDEGVVSNLKLQKLLYYAQGNALARWGRPLFRQQIEAWTHGPVVADVYHQYKGFGTGPIVPEVDMDWSITDSTTDSLLASVWRTYGGFSAWKLREMTHSESPWRDTFVEGERHKVIDQDVIRRHFERLTAEQAHGQRRGARD